MAIKRRRGRKRGPGIVATLRDPKKIRVAYIVAAFALIFGGSLGFGAARCDQNTSSNLFGPGSPGEAVATIEDMEVSYREYWAELESEERRQEAQFQGTLRPPEYRESMKYEVLRRMLDMEYFGIRAREAGIVVSDEEVGAEVEQYRTRMIPSHEYEEDRSLLQRALDALGTVREEQAFEMALQNVGMSLGRLRDIIRQKIMARKYLDQLLAEKNREIMDGLTARVENIKSEIEAGLEFSEAAASYSEHMASRDAGGLIPIVKHDNEDLHARVIDTAFTLPVGEISGPVSILQDENHRGVWLVTVVSRKEASGEEWDSIKGPLGQELLEEKRRQVEAGELEMPPEGSLEVTEEELINHYEEATIRVLHLRAEDPMGPVSQAIEEDIMTMTIEIFEPYLRATHHTYKEEYAFSMAAYREALERNAEKYREDDPESWYYIEMEEARIRYLIGNLWSAVAFRMEQEWIMEAWERYQADPESFGDAFPETPDQIKTVQQIYFVLALKNFDRAIDLESLDPWSHIQRAQLDIARRQVTPRLIEDLESAQDYSSKDMEMENRIFSIVNQAIGFDDKALEDAGGERPETWTDPMWPEDEMGLTLEVLDAAFDDLVEEEVSGEGAETEIEDQAVEPEGSIEDSGPATDDDIADPAIETDDETESEGEDEPVGETVDEGAEILDEANEDSDEIADPDNVNEDEPFQSLTPEVDLPEVPIAEPTGPLTQELRDRLDELQEVVQTELDRLRREQQELEGQQQMDLQRQLQELGLDMPEDGEALSLEGTNLLEEEGD